MAGGCGIHDDRVIRPARLQHGQHTQQLVDAGRRELDELGQPSIDTVPTPALPSASARPAATLRARRASPQGLPARRARARQGCEERSLRAAAHPRRMRRARPPANEPGRSTAGEPSRRATSRARRSAMAAATVVLPTPPFPPQNSNRVPRKAPVGSGLGDAASGAAEPAAADEAGLTARTTVPRACARSGACNAGADPPQAGGPPRLLQFRVEQTDGRQTGVPAHSGDDLPLRLRAGDRRPHRAAREVSRD